MAKRDSLETTAAGNAALATPSDFKDNARRAMAAAINLVVADVFALYVKTKNFHWHMSGPHFRDYHLLLDEQSDQIFAMSDVLAERVRKLGAKTLHSIGEIGRISKIKDNDLDFVPPHGMLTELLDDNKTLLANMRAAHEICDEHNDVATTSILETYIDETERRAWFLFEATRNAV